MKICITLDDVIRAKTKMFGKIYKQRIDNDINLSELDVTTNDMSEVFKFESKEAYNKFLYEDYPFEIFAEAPVVSRMLDKHFNLWHIGIADKYGDKVEILLANPYEFNTSIGFTCFFLSQIATRVRKFVFPKNSSDIWNECDVLVTADPKLLSEKPSEKISVKIEMPYNENAEADYSYENLEAFIEKAEDDIIKKYEYVQN